MTLLELSPLLSPKQRGKVIIPGVKWTSVVARTCVWTYMGVDIRGSGHACVAILYVWVHTWVNTYMCQKYTCRNIHASGQTCVGTYTCQNIRVPRQTCRNRHVLTHSHNSSIRTYNCQNIHVIKYCRVCLPCVEGQSGVLTVNTDIWTSSRSNSHLR